MVANRKKLRNLDCWVLYIGYIHIWRLQFSQSLFGYASLNRRARALLFYYIWLNYFARWGLSRGKSDCGRPGVFGCVLMEFESNEGYITIPMRLR